MANEMMNGQMNGQAMAMGTPMMGAPVQQMTQAPVQQAPAQKIETNMCQDGDRAVVKGKLGFSYYLTRPKIGEALAEDIKRQRLNGAKYINDKPRFEATITEPEIVFSDGRTAAQATMLEKYLHQKFYTNKDGILCMGFSKVTNPSKIQLPAFKMLGTGEKLSLANQSLAEGQTVYITFEIKDSNKGNKGCYVRLIEFEKEPEFFVSNNEYGETWTPTAQTASAPAAPVAPVSQPQAQAPVRGGWGVPQTPVQQPQAPVQTTPVGDGFAPVPEGAVYQEASFWQ